GLDPENAGLRPVRSLQNGESQTERGALMGRPALDSPVAMLAPDEIVLRPGGTARKGGWQEKDTSQHKAAGGTEPSQHAVRIRRQNTDARDNGVAERWPLPEHSCRTCRLVGQQSGGQEWKSRCRSPSRIWIL